MPSGLPLVIFVVGAILIALLAYAGYIEHSRRLKQLGALALQLDWQFDSAEDREHDERYSHFSPFGKGSNRRAYNTLRGAITVGGRMWPAQAGDYRYTTQSGSGKNRSTHTHRLSYLIVETPHLGAPDLAIRREGLFDRFASFMGFDDIDFESHEFSERFHVKSSNKRFAYAVLEPRMMEFLLEHDAPAIEFRRGQCCVTRGERAWTPEQFAATIHWAAEFFARWPEKVASVLDDKEHA
jgi:hypothetical protein